MLTTTNTIITAATITTEQVEDLRTEAGAAGDALMVRICTVALRGAKRSHRMSARATCAATINAARAQVN